MRVLVVGAGAIGSVLGGFLANASHDVTLLGRAWHLDVVTRQGLQLTGLWGEHVVRVATVTAREELRGTAPFDWVFVCVKAHQTAEVAGWLPDVMAPQTLLCAFQNGLGNYETLSRAVAPERIALGRVIFGAELQPGLVRVTV